MTSTRREFLAVGGAIAGAAAAGRASANPLGVPVGLQPFTVRAELEKDFEGTMKRIAGAGYGALETGDPFYGRKTRELRTMLDGLGMVSPSGFYPYPKDEAAWDRSIEKAQILGNRYMITTAPGDWLKTPEGWKSIADRFNTLAAQSKRAGTVLAYHNHNFEFKKGAKGGVFYDELLRLTDPELVKMELDCFWATLAGRSPLDLFTAHPGRFALLHVKGLKEGVAPTLDWPKGNENPFTEVGAGVIDYRKIFQAARPAGVQYYFVEQDRCDRSPLESIRISCDYLKKLEV